ncbi:MAG: bacillithiol system redox-active protein YtxJ [Sphingobacteriales bacterium]|nr:MAG: bacillithiol system redox-active protein YtxJ [Sphingobacteriales bacterium]
MNWTELTTEEQLEEIKQESFKKPVLIFKHSTRCSISSMAKNRLERGEAPGHISFYHLDLIRFRNISNRIAEVFKVHHESPQVLLIRNGECIYDESHNGISMDEIAGQAA